MKRIEHGMELSDPFRKLIPEIIGPFRLVREIGAGAHGVVFLAERSAQFSQRVAIKIFFPELNPVGGSSLELPEAVSLSELKHPGIVRLLDSGVTTSGLRYLVMEYVEGGPIDTYCDEARLSVMQRIEVLCSVLDALEYAHRRLVIHADLKPDNIRVTADGRARLLDFGTAGLVTELQSNQSDDGSLETLPENSEHTPLYASPEQRRGERLTIASDLFSMGLILRLILAGVKPGASAIPLREGAEAEDMFVPASKMLAGLDRITIGQIAQNRRVTPETLRKSLGPDIDAIIERALQINPADRYESAQEMKDELERFRLGYPLRTRPIGSVGRVYKWALRNRAAASLAAVLLLVICLSVAGVALRSAEANRQRQIAQDRLHDLVRLTDSFAGELIGSVRGLQGADAAQDELLKNAHQTIRALAAEEGDPRLQLELSRQLDRLAKLELARARNNVAAGQMAQEDIHQAAKLLDRLSQSDPEVSRLRKENEDLAKSQNGKLR